jgi:hypothetical protein
MIKSLFVSVAIIVSIAIVYLITLSNISSVGFRKYLPIDQETSLVTTFHSKSTDLNSNQELVTEKICSNYEITHLKTQTKTSDHYKFSHFFDRLANNPNDLINDFKPLDLNDGYASHAIPLIVTSLISNGDMIELGMGKYSTAILNKVAKKKNAFLISTESNRDWMSKFTSFNDTKTHLLVSSDSACGTTLNMNKFWGFVFVDHIDAAKRHLDVLSFANNSQIVMCHDAEKNTDSMYLYSKIYKSFKHHCKYSLFLNDNRYISTSILSNFVALDGLEEILKKINIDKKFVVCDENLKK